MNERIKKFTRIKVIDQLNSRTTIFLQSAFQDGRVSIGFESKEKEGVDSSRERKRERERRKRTFFLQS